MSTMPSNPEHEAEAQNVLTIIRRIKAGAITGRQLSPEDRQA